MILASLVALLDVFFIVLFVPESLLSEQKMAIKSLTFKQVKHFQIEIKYSFANIMIFIIMDHNVFFKAQDFIDSVDTSINFSFACR